MKKYLLLLLLQVSIAFPFSAQNKKIDSLETALKTEQDDTTKVKTLNGLARQLLSTGDYEKGKQYANTALRLARKLNYIKGEGNANNNLGIIFYYQGNPTESLRNYALALKKYGEINYKKGIANCYNNIGIIYYNQGDYTEALRNYQSALRMRDPERDKVEIANGYNNIGELYFDLKNYAEALKNINESVKLNLEIGNKNGLASCYGNIGQVYDAQGNYSDALKLFFEELKIAEETGDKNQVANSYINLGKVYENQGNYSEALKNCFASLKMSVEIGDKPGIAVCYKTIGNLEIKFKKFREAKTYLDSALTISTRMGYKPEIKDTYNFLTMLDSATGNWQNAYEHHKQYIIYRDSLVNEVNTKKLVQAQMEYEYDKRETKLKAEQDKKDALSREELEWQKMVRNSFMAGFALVLLLALVAIRGYREKQKANKLLDDANHSLMKLNDELLTTMENLKLAQQQLIVHERLAAFGNMATRMAHEIQNPLNFVNNFSELCGELADEIANATDDDERNEAIKMIKENLNKINHHGRRASDIIYQLQEKNRAGTAHEFFEEDESNK